MDLSRLLRHRWYDAGDARRALGDEALARLAQRVVASERGHSGEIRICVEAGLPLAALWRKHSPRQRALALFAELGVWDTEQNNGVLIYLLLAERAIEIVADRGMMRQVAPEHWAALVEQMRQHFVEARFEAGLAATIDAVSALLDRHFPLAEGQMNPNELPDSVDLR